MHLRLTDAVSPTRLISFSTRYDCDNLNVRSDILLMLTPRHFDISPSSFNSQFSGQLLSDYINDVMVSFLYKFNTQ